MLCPVCGEPLYETDGHIQECSFCGYRTNKKSKGGELPEGTHTIKG